MAGAVDLGTHPRSGRYLGYVIDGTDCARTAPPPFRGMLCDGPDAGTTIT